VTLTVEARPRAEQGFALLLPDLTAYAWRRARLHQLPAADADDLAQSALERFLRSRIQFTSPRQASAWCRTCIRRIALDRIRRPGPDVLNQAGLVSLDENGAGE
jgi:DNA-directed RNA polymerase specialized sigma24 family protein